MLHMTSHLSCLVAPLVAMTIAAHTLAAAPAVSLAGGPASPPATSPITPPTAPPAKSPAKSPDKLPDKLPDKSPDKSPAKPVPAPAVPGASSPGEKVPTMNELVDRLVTALGGVERWSRITSRRVTLSTEFAGLGTTAVEVVELARMPNHKMVSTTVPGIGDIQEGFDGEIAWSIDPLRGPIIGTEEQARQQKRVSDFRRLLRLAELYPKVESIAEVEWRGTPCWEAKVASDDDDRTTLYFAKDTGLLRGEEMVVETPAGAISTVTINSLYSEFDGVKVVAETQIEMLGQVQKVTVKKVEFNVPEAEKFELPPAIKALRAPPPLSLPSPSLPSPSLPSPIGPAGTPGTPAPQKPQSPIRNEMAPTS